MNYKLTNKTVFAIDKELAKDIIKNGVLSYKDEDVETGKNAIDEITYKGAIYCIGHDTETKEVSTIWKDSEEQFGRTFKIMRNNDNNFKEENGKKFLSFEAINWDDNEDGVKTVWIGLKYNKFEMLRQDLANGVYKIQNILTGEIYWVSHCEWYNSFRETTTDELLLKRVKEKINDLEVELVKELSAGVRTKDNDFIKRQRGRLHSLKDVKNLIECIDIELQRME